MEGLERSGSAGMEPLHYGRRPGGHAAFAFLGS